MAWARRFSTKGLGYHQFFFVIIIIGNKTSHRRASGYLGYGILGFREIGHPLVYGLGLEGSSPWRNSLMGRHGHDGMGILGGGGALYPWRGMIPTSTCGHTHTPFAFVRPRAVTAAYTTTHSSLDGSAVSTHQSTLVLERTTVKFPSASIAGRRTGAVRVPTCRRIHLLHFCLTGYEPKTVYFFITPPFLIYIYHFCNNEQRKRGLV